MSDLFLIISKIAAVIIGVCIVVALMVIILGGATALFYNTFMYLSWGV